MNNKAQFTPGPWNVTHGSIIPRVYGPDDNLIAEIHPQRRRDAHLIAAAPAMYEALQVLCREIHCAVSIENGIVSFPDGGYLDLNPLLAQAEGKAE